MRLQTFPSADWPLNKEPLTLEGLLVTLLCTSAHMRLMSDGVIYTVYARVLKAQLGMVFLFLFFVCLVF